MSTGFIILIIFLGLFLVGIFILLLIFFLSGSKNSNSSKTKDNQIKNASICPGVSVNAPTNINAKSSGSYIQVTWTSAPAVDGYNFYASSTDPNFVPGPSTFIQYYVNSSNNLINVGPFTDGTYYFKMASFLKNGNKYCLSPSNPSIKIIIQSAGPTEINTRFYLNNNAYGSYSHGPTGAYLASSDNACANSYPGTQVQFINSEYSPTSDKFPAASVTAFSLNGYSDTNIYLTSDPSKCLYIPNQKTGNNTYSCLADCNQISDTDSKTWTFDPVSGYLGLSNGTSYLSAVYTCPILTTRELQGPFSLSYYCSIDDVKGTISPCSNSTDCSTSGHRDYSIWQSIPITT